MKGRSTVDRPAGLAADPLPAWELRFRFSSGRLCLAFCATVGERWLRCFERLRTPADLGRWLVAASLSAAPPSVSADELAAARDLREAIYRLVAASITGGAGDPADTALLNAWARRPALAPQLGGPAWPTGRPVDAALATVARDAVDLLGGPDAGRVRECDAHDCALLFLDTSRPGRRRWCSDGACGNRARGAAFRRRATAAASS